MITAYKPLAAALIAVSLLAGCKSDEEKAEEFYQSGLSYLEQGDVDRALIEFRNVFRLDGFHKDARMAYAKLVLEQGDAREAYGQFLRLVEQYPDTVEARATLARLAIDSNNWEEARRHGEAAIRLDPERIDVKAIAAALAYRDARLENDTEAAAAAAEEARAVLAEDPSLMIARRMLIDQALWTEDTETALTEIDGAIAEAPERAELQMLKAQLLAQSGDQEALGAQLKTMYERFPENEQVGQGLIAWYMSQRDFAGAESFLRDKAGPDDGPIEGHLPVIEFLQRTKGPEAAMAEAERLMQATEGLSQNDVYAAARASLLFETGRRDEGIAAAEAILTDAEPSDQTRRVRIVLARMLAATGNVVGARAEVETVLEEDPTNTDALKMRAAWLIQTDKPDQAILDLRTALDQSPRDPEILTLMAEAHQRNGSPQLAQERLALAVEVSGNRAPESLRYARFVLQQGRPALAETVLDAARKVSPANIEILGMLSDLYLRDRRWDAADDIVATLKQIDSDQARTMATRLESAILVGQENVEGGLTMMQQAIEDPAGADLGTLVQVLRTQVATGRGEEARAYLDDLMAEHPDNLALWLFDASLLTTEGKLDAAEARYRQILEQNPQVEPAAVHRPQIPAPFELPVAAPARGESGHRAHLSLLLVAALLGPAAARSKRRATSG